MKTTWNSISDVAAGVVGRAGQEEALAAEEAPLRRSPIRNWFSVGVPPMFAGAALIADRAELERVADGVVGEEREHVGREVQHHQVRRRSSCGPGRTSAARSRPA